MAQASNSQQEGRSGPLVVGSTKGAVTHAINRWVRGPMDSTKGAMPHYEGAAMRAAVAHY